MCFNQSPVTVTVKVMDSIIIRSYTINDQLSTQIFKDILRYSHLKYDHSAIADLIKDNEWFFENHSDEIKEIINEWIQIDYTGIIEFLRYHNKFGELENTTFRKLVMKVCNEHITIASKKNTTEAINLLIQYASLFPYESQEEHYDWFVEHYKNVLSSGDSKSIIPPIFKTAS